MYASFNYIHEINIKKSDTEICSHPGPCDDDVLRLSQMPYIKRQISKIDPEQLRKELKEYGAWDDDELNNHAENIQRILWIASGDIVDGK